MGNQSIAIIAIAVFALVGFGFYRHKSKKIMKPRTDKQRYKEDTWFVEHYIQQKDWEMLENMLNSGTKDFPDLIEKIQNALKNKQG